MLEKLTPEQEQLCDTVAKEYDSHLRPTEPDLPVIQAWLEILYSFYDLECPDIRVVDSPFAALDLATELTGKKQDSLDWCGVSDSGWVAFYDYFHRIGVLQDDEVKELLALRAFQRCAWDMIALDELAIVVRMPTVIGRDDDGQLHCATGPALAWKDGNQEWSWHGVWVPQKLIMDPLSYTKAEYEAITDTEVRRAFGEHAGWDFVTELLGAKTVDIWKDEVTGLSYGLLAAGVGDTLQKWLRKQSPVLQNGSQPFYIEPVHEDLKTARAARKWQADRRLSVSDCEADPELVYGQET